MKEKVLKLTKILKRVRWKRVAVLLVPIMIVIAVLVGSSIKKTKIKLASVNITDMPTEVAADNETVEETSLFFEDDTSLSTEETVNITIKDDDALESGSAVSTNISSDDDSEEMTAYALVYCWIRSGSSDRASKVGELYYGDEVKVIEIGDTFTKIRTDSDTGYVRNEYLSSTKPVWVGNLYNTHKISLNLVVSSSAKYIISDFNVLSQMPDMPSGCELTSLTMVLNYYGINCDKELVANYLPTGSYGDNYFTQFIGSVFEDNSYGCFADCICTCAQNYLNSIGNTNLTVGNISGTSIDNLLGLVACGYPVIVWGTEGMKTVGDNSYIWTYEGQPMGYIRGEHCLVLVGFDKENDKVYMADPIEGKIMEYSLTAFKLRYRAQFSQAVLIY